MKAIYACKLYKASTRKSKIQAALNDPLNLELVTQLKSYLDEEYQDIVERQEAKDKAELVADVAAEPDDSTEGNSPESGGFSSGPGGFGGPAGGRPSLSEKFDMLLSEEEDNDLGDLPEEGSDELSDSPETDDDFELEEVEESTAIEGIQEIDPSPSVDLSAGVKDLLNSDESTSGINRVMTKKNELWIHYNDNINLNNVMGPAIEKLNSEGYAHIDFNRLARSENAIVFQINSEPSHVAHEEETNGI